MKPNVKFFHIFGCKCFVLRMHPEREGQFDAKSDEAIFLGYSSTSKAYRVFNLRKRVIVESYNVNFDDQKIEGYEVDSEHDQLEFENQVSVEEEDLEDFPEYIDAIPPQESAPVEGEQAEENATSDPSNVTVTNMDQSREVTEEQQLDVMESFFKDQYQSR